MDPWEAVLDVDESDLPSLLRPCKRRLIPGPAAQVQSAMLQKTHHNNHSSAHPIPTQDYITKALQDTSGQFDPHFQSNSWLSALHFLGAVDGVIPSTPLSSIRNCLDVGKVDRVVAVINSSTPNGFGGLMVTLKDPTGMIDASIHHRVLSESEFGKDLLTGSVVILQKVAVFAPSRAACYLNITLRNVIKVFTKDGNPPPKQISAAYDFVAPENDCESQASRLDSMSFSEFGSNKDTQEEARGNTIMRQVQNDTQRVQENIVPRDTSCQKEVSINQSPSKRRCSSLGQDSINAAFEIPAGKKGDFDTTEASTTAETERASRVQNQTQPLLARTSLPLYTDEQLNLLFANDDDDDGFVY